MSPTMSKSLPFWSAFFFFPPETPLNMLSPSSVIWRYPKPLFHSQSYRRYALLLLVAISVYFIVSHNLANSGKETHPNKEKQTPNHDLQAKARFLYRSPFRDHPDVEYEAELDAALRDLERKALLEDDRLQANDTVWQIMLGKIMDMSDDSVAFEHQNAEWEYSVRLFVLYCTYITS